MKQLRLKVRLKQADKSVLVNSGGVPTVDKSNLGLATNLVASAGRDKEQAIVWEISSQLDANNSAALPSLDHHKTLQARRNRNRS